MMARGIGRSSRTKQRGGRHGAALFRGCLALLAGGLMLAGCADDRITLEQMYAREKEQKQAEPIPVRMTDLGLTELRPYTLGLGDTVGLTMIGLAEGYAEMKIKCRVHPEGQVYLPLVGEVKVGGMTLQQAEAAIAAAYTPKYVKAMSVYVELAGPEATTVLVAGAAAKPGLVTLPTNQRTVLYALSNAGGFGGLASYKVRVRPIRPEEEELVYNLADPNDVRKAMTARPLESGDIVTVEGAQNNAVYVSGLVNAPGPVSVPIDSTITVMHAVYAAGGLRDMLEPQEATLIRTMPDGKRAHVKLELASILTGKADDVPLHAGDILTVPHTADTRFRDWAINNLRIGPFNMGVTYDPLSQYNVQRALDDSGNNFRSSIRQTLQYGIPNLLVPQVPIPAQ